MLSGGCKKVMSGRKRSKSDHPVETPEPAVPGSEGAIGKKARQAFDQEIPEVKVIDKRSWLQDEGSVEEPLPELNLKPTVVQELEQRMRLMEERFQEKTQYFHDETRRIQERLNREMERRLQEEKNRLILEFLEVLDNLDMALDAARNESDAGQLLEGVRLVREMFFRKLGLMGLVTVGAEGDEFDPNIHEAIELRPVDDVALDGRVVGVWQKGFQVEARLIRPARVSVGRYGGGEGAE